MNRGRAQTDSINLLPPRKERRRQPRRREEETAMVPGKSNLVVGPDV